VIIWSFESLSLLHRLKLHKVLVQSLSFSHNELYLASLGGEDDKRLVIWEVATGKGLCGNSAGPDAVNSIKFYNNCDDQLVSVKNLSANIWKVDYVNKKVSQKDKMLRSPQLKSTSAA
jgi:WD40 repeat protein